MSATTKTPSKAKADREAAQTGVRVYQTLTENRNGRIKSADSATGWKRRAGTETVENPDAKRAKDRRTIRVVWEECPAPRSVVVGTPEAEGVRGGVLDTHIEGLPETTTVDLPAHDVEVLIRHYLHRYTSARFAANGGTIIGGPSMDDPVGEAITCRNALLRLGVDVETLALRW